jgi:hypothetical protein
VTLHRRVAHVVLLLVAVLLFGTVGYVLVEGWPFLDGLST